MPHFNIWDKELQEFFAQLEAPPYEFETQSMRTWFTQVGAMQYHKYELDILMAEFNEFYPQFRRFPDKTGVQIGLYSIVVLRKLKEDFLLTMQFEEPGDKDLFDTAYETFLQKALDNHKYFYQKRAEITSIGLNKYLKDISLEHNAEAQSAYIKMLFQESILNVQDRNSQFYQDVTNFLKYGDEINLTLTPATRQRELELAPRSRNNSPQTSPNLSGSPNLTRSSSPRLRDRLTASTAYIMQQQPTNSPLSIGRNLRKTGSQISIHGHSSRTPDKKDDDVADEGFNPISPRRTNSRS